MSGTSIPNSSPQAIMRTKHTATRMYGWDTPGSLTQSSPRYKFLYFVNFVPSSDAMQLFSTDLSNLHDPVLGISFKIRSFDKPKVDLTTVELNQYNRKRLVYTKAEYHQGSIKLFDTVDDAPLKMWIDYFTYYFGDSRQKTSLAYNQSTVNSTFFDSSGWGFRPVQNNTNFFERIELYAFFGQSYTQINYINPKITGIDWESHETASSDPEELTINYKYEALQYVNSNAPITPDLLTLFGFNVDPATIEVPGAANFGNSTLDNNGGSLEAMSGFLAQVSPISTYSLEAGIMGLFGINGGLSVGSIISDTVSSAGSSIFGQIKTVLSPAPTQTNSGLF